ncbi:hypothetical protein HZS_7778 [Henneguya salminicola]|nr:hypothetical protein HZS_7778 [Henneguya salminicola]
MQQIFESLDKIRWHRRYEKLNSLFKRLKYNLAGKETLNTFGVFISLEQILNNYNTGYLTGREFTDEELLSLKSVHASFTEMLLPENELTRANILFDQKLILSKCNYMLKNYDKIVEYSQMLFKNTLTQILIWENLQNYSKYTWRLMAEVLLATASIIYHDSSFKALNKFAIETIVVSVEILYNLIKFQENVLIKRIKTSHEIYSELLDLMFLAFNLYACLGIRQNGNLNKFNYSIINVLKNINMNFTSEKSVVSETSVFSPYSYILETCSIILNYVSPQPQYNSKLSNDCISPYRHNVSVCLDAVTIILSQTGQYDQVSSLILQYLPSFFENTYTHFLLACSLFSSCHYAYCLQACYRIGEFDPQDSRYKPLLLNILINIFYRYDEAIDTSSRFLVQEPDNVIFYHSRAISHLEKSIESLSLGEAKESLALAQTDILKALELDDKDHEIYFYAALIFALSDETDIALSYSFEATRRSLFDPRPYHLMFLILVSKRLYDEAIKVIMDIEHEFPSDFGVLINKINFEHYYYGPETALNSIRNALEMWHGMYSFSSVNAFSDEPDGDKSSPQEAYLSISEIINKSHSDRLNKEQYTELATFSELFKIQKTNMKIVLTSPHDVKESIILLILLFQKLAEIYLDTKDMEGLSKCLSDILSLGYTCPEVFLTQAKYYKALDEPKKCKECIETALYLEPNHVDSLYYLTLHCLEEYEKEQSEHSNDLQQTRQYLISAEENARRLVKVAPKNFISWQCLGKVLHETGNHEESAYCLNRALELERFFSILPFKTVFRRFKPSDINISNVI